MNAADTLRAAIAKRRPAPAKPKQAAPPPPDADQSSTIAWQANRIVELAVALAQADEHARSSDMVRQAHFQRTIDLQAELDALRATLKSAEVTTDWALYWRFDDGSGRTYGGAPYNTYGMEADAREEAQDIADNDATAAVWIAQERVTKITETLQRVDF